MTMQANVSAQTHQLWNMHHAILKYGFGNRTDAFCDAIQRAKLRLHIGWERRIGCSRDVDRFWTASGHIQSDPINAGADMRTRFLQLRQHRIQRSRARVRCAHVTASHRSGDQKCAGFNAICHYRKVGSVHP